MKRVALAALAAILASTLAIPAATSSGKHVSSEYLVLYADDASPASAHAAVARSGGTIVQENRRVGLATVRSTSPGFLQTVRSQGAIDGRLGTTPSGGPLPGRGLSASCSSACRRRAMQASARAA